MSDQQQADPQFLKLQESFNRVAERLAQATRAAYKVQEDIDRLHAEMDGLEAQAAELAKSKVQPKEESAPDVIPQAG